MNHGPESMRLAQLFWKQDQAIRAAGGRPVFATWADTLRGAWAQTRAVPSMVSRAALHSALRVLLYGSRTIAANMARRIVREIGQALTASTRIRLVGLIHQQATGRSRPAYYH